MNSISSLGMGIGWNSPDLSLGVEGNIIAGETMGSPRIVMIKEGRAFLFDPSNEDNYERSVGINLNSVVAGTTASILRLGILKTSGLTPQVFYYAGANGVLTTILPTTGIFLKVGLAIDDKNLFVDFSESIIQV